MNRDIIAFMREYYPQVSTEQFHIGTILTIEDNQEEEDEWRTVYLQQKFVLDRGQSPPRKSLCWIRGTYTAEAEKEE
jgi:hypothetical protein